jgi:glycosyltransferase involved in cell wall biosynthesis
MRDLIFVSLEDWDDIWRRNQFLCAAWARRFPANKILFVGQQQMLWQHLRRNTLKPLLQNPSWSVPGLPNISATFLPKPLPNPIPGGRLANEKAARDHIVAMSRQMGLRDPLLWLNPNDAGHLIGKVGERGVVYDITDDWELAEPDERRRAQVAAHDREMCRRADLTVVCSQALAQSRRGVARRLLLLPNGVDGEHYKAAGRPPQNSTPRRWPGPTFGYTGTLHPQRIDLGLVLSLARAHPDGSVVLVGPINWNDDSLQKALDTTPNLFAPDSVPYAEIPGVMAQFDVCIVPHCQSEFVESLNPIKLWEYLACGKPIASTNVAGFRDYPQFCRVAATPAEFLAACEAALAEAHSGDDTVALARREEAARHSWESRLDDLLREMHACGLLPENHTQQAPTASIESASTSAACEPGNAGSGAR